MRRKIKFRVWETAMGGQMIYDLDDLFKNPSVIPSKIFNCEDKLLFPQEWTGLFDINGKEIYEDDIVKIHRDKKYPGTSDWISSVIFERGCFVTKNGFTPVKDNIILTEVIGNIYENPELLK
jgi:uncharacterized phage protein (TIGR01671 family)